MPPNAPDEIAPDVATLAVVLIPEKLQAIGLFDGGPVQAQDRIVRDRQIRDGRAIRSDDQEPIGEI